MSLNLERNDSEESHDHPPTRYSALGLDTIDELDRRVQDVFEKIKEQLFWRDIFSSECDNAALTALLREIFLSVCWYQKHTTEAGFHMLGRLPKHEVRLLRSLLAHKAEEAEHGEWALRDYLALGGSEERARNTPMSPACFAVTGTWWRMAATEDPFGYLGAEHLFEYLTALVTQPLLAEFSKRGFAVEDVGFIIEHATEDIKHTNLIRHWIGDCVTRYPDSYASMLRCFDYFHQVYPIPVWQEAAERAKAK